MNILITGATGFIGAHLTLRLANMGHKVHALVHHTVAHSPIEHPNVVIFKGDVLDKNSIEEAMKGCEQVYHLAAFVKPWAKQKRLYFIINVIGTNNVLDIAKKQNIQRVVVTSSATVFGTSINGVVTEKTSRNMPFFNNYESSKAYSESKIKDYVINGLDVVIVSPTRVYGPPLTGQTEAITKLIYLFLYKRWRIIPGDGSKIANYIFVDDAVNGQILAMEKGKKGETYILGGENYDYNQFFNTLRKETGINRKMIYVPIWLQLVYARFQLIKTWFGKEPTITPNWVSKSLYDWEVSADRAKKELGLTTTSLEEGVRKTVEWLKEING